MRRTIPGSAFDESANDLMGAILTLVVAAGGTIVVPPDLMAGAWWKLIVEQDKTTGVKTYRAERVAN